MKKYVNCNHNKPYRPDPPADAKEYFGDFRLFRLYYKSNEGTGKPAKYSRKVVQEYTFDALGINDNDALYDALSGILDTLGYKLQRKVMETPLKVRKNA